MEVATCQSMCFANQSSQRNCVGCSDWGVSCVHSSNSPLRVSRSCACTPPQQAKRVGVSRQKHFGRVASASRRHPHLLFFGGNDPGCIMSVLTREVSRSMPPRRGRVWSRRVLPFRMLQILATPHKPLGQSAPCGETRSINLGHDLQQCRKPKARSEPTLQRQLRSFTTLLLPCRGRDARPSAASA